MNTNNNPAKHKTSETKFNAIVSLFNWMQKTKPSAKKRTLFRKFIDKFCRNDDYFSAIRLILPSLDRERGSYGLKESVLATSLIDALGMARDSPDALRLIGWRKGGASAGANAGNFSLVASEVLQRRQGRESRGLTIGELNEFLDRLASSENRGDKISVLSTMINKTNAEEMKWIVMIILKDLKLGLSEKSIFHEFHPDAEDLFNVTCDLKLVCEKLRDKTQRHKRQDIEVGKAVRPQLAMRIANAANAWKKLHGKDVVVECKFDGDRIQIHKNTSDIHYYSRNFLDHSEYEHAMSDILKENILVDRCILDGEMLVWDTTLDRFAEFGSNQEIAKAARDGLDSDRQLCYVAFDILYAGDTSVIHQTLKERQELLQKVVKPLKGRLEILIPNGGLNSRHHNGEPCWSRIAYSADDVERFFKETVENRDEGIVVKDLSSTWDPGDRSGKWLKLKPDYVNAGSDLDVIVIGGYYGSGRRGGEIAQFLLGLAERSASNAYPRRFVSFCRVGTGLSDEELDALVTKLKPHFRKYEYPKKAPPSFYHVTNNSKERPDVWIESPEKSVILSITSDIRTIKSGVFAAPYSLRFPRIDKVRYDKPWHECLDVQAFVELVHSSNGTTQRGTEHGQNQNSKPKRLPNTRKGEKKNMSVVPAHFIQTNVSDVKEETSIFSNMMFYFLNVPPSHSLDSLHKMITENGGSFSMNSNNSVTHCVAAESRGMKYRAAKLRGDIIHNSWILDCCAQKKLLPLQPKYFLHLSDTTKKKLQEEIDEYSDSYYLDLDLPDVKKLLGSIDRSEDARTIDYYKKKYCPRDKWSCFHGCCIYFHISMQTINGDWEVLLEFGLRRMKVEVAMGGGKVTNDLAHATHLVVMIVPGSIVEFNSLLKSFPSTVQRLLQHKRLYVVGYQWLEDSLERGQKLQEDMYSLRPSHIGESAKEECNQDQCIEDKADHLDDTENRNTSYLPEKRAKEDRGNCTVQTSSGMVSPERDNKRKRVTPVRGKAKKGKPVPKRAPTRAPIRKKLAKISEDRPVESDLDEDMKDVKMTDEILGNRGKEKIENQENKIVEDSQPSQAGDTQEIKLLKDSLNGQEDSADLSSEIGSYRGAEIGNDKSEVVLDKNDEKPEILEDPVQAMLKDMIPSLRLKKPESSEPIQEETIPEFEPDPKPSKKKKVSYKDVANELLKDF